jgi:hypothetical protein
VLSSKLFAPFPNANPAFLGLDARLALGNRSTGTETPGQILLQGNLDKQFSLQNALSETQYSFQTAWAEHAMAMARKQQQQQSYLSSIGVIFA